MSEPVRIAREVRVERRGQIARLYFDGTEFPYLLAYEGIKVGDIHPDDMPTVRFTVLAERVDVINQFEPDPEGTPE
ncbi:hypothetical protein AB4225_06070 [Streptomyces sp. 2RAF24]|uniref:hypothetical protein n=1 Tax=Streptomyces sp. 2RAF24 TaxID=3232997 RepID=UPI003F94C851